MSHGRTQIRNALATTLTGLATTAARVFVNRVYPLTEAELPCLMIATDGEQIDHATTAAPRTQLRELTATVRIVARATASLDTTLDTSLQEIETALAANRTLGGLTRDCRLDRVEITLDDGADRPTGLAIVTLALPWVATEGVPATPL